MTAVGLLVLRLLLAALLAGHALQKLAGWFQGMGPTRTGEMFETWGFRPGRQMVLLAGACEIAGAFLLATGLITRLGCAIVIGTMIVAAAPNAKNGLWAHLGGCEVPVVYAGLGVVLAITGPGTLSLDHAFGIPDGHVGGALVAVVVGVLASIPPLLRRNQALRSTS
ncbi:MAG: DoxX family protein [Nocardioides sp.]|nr:DoxX family protein [Nocardioides sp.]